MKKVLIVADEPGWVFERHAREIKKRLPEYDINIAFHNQNIPDLSRQYDLVYAMDPMPMRYPPKEKTIMGLRCEFLFREHPEGPNGLYEGGFPGRCVSIKDKCSVFHVVNKYQMQVFSKVVLDKPLLLCQHGIDESIFDRNKYQRTKNDVLTIGVSGRDSNNKGFGIVKEACNRAGVRFVSAQYSNKIKKEGMPSFYNGIDVFVCFSKTEGLHNGTMEAGSMGIPVISTKCGAAEEMIQDKQSGLIIDRNLDSLVAAINTMKDDDARSKMGDNFYQEIMKNWTWNVKKNDFKNMFDRFFKL